LVLLDGDAYNHPCWIRLPGPFAYSSRRSSGVFRSFVAVNYPSALGDDMPRGVGHSGLNENPGLFTVDERMWSIFVAYSQKNLTFDEIGRKYGVPVNRVRRVVRQLEAEVGRMGPTATGDLGAESAIEDLGLPVRTRNALRSVGCTTIGDAIRLDLSAPVRGLGAKSKRALLEKLRTEGFCHPGAKDPPVSEFRLLERSLERIQRRVDSAFGAVTKEISAVKQRLRRR
jgi:hypothetical protein